MCLPEVVGCTSGPVPSQDIDDGPCMRMFWLVLLLARAAPSHCMPIQVHAELHLDQGIFLSLYVVYTHDLMQLHISVSIHVS